MLHVFQNAFILQFFTFFSHSYYTDYIYLDYLCYLCCLCYPCYPDDRLEHTDPDKDQRSSGHHNFCYRSYRYYYDTHRHGCNRMIGVEIAVGSCNFLCCNFGNCDAIVLVVVCIENFDNFDILERNKKNITDVSYDVTAI